MRKPLIFAVTIVTFTVGLFWILSLQNSVSDTQGVNSQNPQPPRVAAVDKDAPIPPIEDWNSEIVNGFQINAMASAIDSIGQEEPSDLIQQRPEYVSPAEWLILKNVAQQHPTPNIELTRMVNYLRFEKLLETWETSSDLPNDKRSQLAEQLLASIPNRIKNGDFDLARAQELQSNLINALFDDPGERRQHLQQESARIGITFEIN